MSLLNFTLGGANWSRTLLATTATVVVCAGSALAQNTLTVKGVVKDAQGEPLIGVNVRVKGSSQGVATDLDGKFSLANVKRNAQLEFSYVGMVTQLVAVNGQANLSVVLRDDANELKDVVVVGYGRQKKVNLTGAVSSVGAKDLAARPVQNVTQVLQGMVPGLNISTTNSGGALDAGMSLNVRGPGTIGAGSNSAPLVLIDGVEGSMNSLSPNDIESISVLKDASASAIYGSRAAFGVILITTKNGREGKTRISYNGNVRFSTATQIPKMLDSYRFAQYFNRAAQNNGNPNPFSDETLAKIKAYQEGSTDPAIAAGIGPKTDGSKDWQLYFGAWANTNWFDYFYDKNVPAHEHNVSVTGGTKKLNYYISGSIFNQRGLLSVAKDQFNRYNMTAKLSAEVTKWLDVSYTHRWVREDFERPTYMTGLFFHNIARRFPTNPTHTPSGHPMEGQEIIQLVDGGRQNKQTDFSNQQLTLTAKPIQGLMLRAEGNYNIVNTHQHWAVLPVYYYNSANERKGMSWNGGAVGKSEVHEDASKNMFFSGKFYGEYAREFGKHDVKVMAGLDMDINRYRNLGLTREDLITPDVISVNTATNEKTSVYGGYNHWATMGMFGRLNYIYDNRYLFEFSLRRDGSSRFIGDKTWGTFPSFSLGWNIANEAFWGDLKKHVGQLKLRASWGALGNTNTQSLYPWFQSLNINVASNTGGSGWLLNGNRQTQSFAPGIVSTSLTWERVQSWNVGVDFAAFNNRLQGTFDYFVRDTKDMVGPPEPLTSLLGTAQPRANNTDMRSQGWELELRWRDQIKDFRYGAKLVLSDYIATVTKYYNPTKSLNSWYSGRRSGDIWGYTTVGIAKSQKEMDEHLKDNLPGWGNNWGEGDVMYADLGGGQDGAKDGKVNSGANTLDNPGDLRIIGNNTPRYSFSATLDAAWRGFDFSIMLQGIGKRDYYLGGPYFEGVNMNRWQAAGFEEHWNFYRPEGDPLGANVNAYYPRPVMDNGGRNFQTQTRFLQNAAYLRIKNMQLGYTLPYSLTQKFGVSSMRMYLSVDNLVTFTKLSKIFDPEALGSSYGNASSNSGKIYPLQRTWSFGLNVSI